MNKGVDNMLRDEPHTWREALDNVRAGNAQGTIAFTYGGSATGVRGGAIRIY